MIFALLIAAFASAESTEQGPAERNLLAARQLGGGFLVPAYAPRPMRFLSQRANMSQRALTSAGAGESKKGEGTVYIMPVDPYNTPFYGGIQPGNAYLRCVRMYEATWPKSCAFFFACLC